MVLLALLLAGVRLVGFTPYTVLSGSMEPAYHVGSLIYVQKTDTNTLQEGDPITFTRTSGLVVTHRIIEVVEENGSRFFRTQGDANEIPDGGAVPARKVIGVPVFTIPLLGYVANFVQSLPGVCTVLGVVVVLLLLSFLQTDKQPPQDDTLDVSCREA